MELVFLAAEPREFAGFLRHVEKPAGAVLPVHWAREGLWRGRKVVLIANGAGPIRSAGAAKACESAAAIISVGFCGALDPNLTIGDVIVADKVFFNNQMFDCRPASNSANHRHGAIRSVSRIVSTAGDKAELARSGAIAVEMEAGGIAEIAQHRGLPFYCIKAVSDLAGESFVNDFQAALDEDGRFRKGRLVGSALLRPGERIPELIRLKKRCDLAAKKLGEFLDSCRF